MKNRFEVVSPFSPQGDQPQAIDKLTANLSSGANFQTLLSATSNLVSRRDVLLVASVSCIFGLGSPESYKTSVLPIRKDIETDRDQMLRKLIDLQYARN